MNWRTIGLYAAYVVLWAVFSMTCLWITFEFMELINQLALLLVTINPNPDPNVFSQANQLIAFSKWITIPVGLLGVALIVWLEEYLRRGIDKNIFWQRVLRVLILEGTSVIVIEGLLLVL